MSRTILISAVLLAMTSVLLTPVLLTDNRATAQDREDPVRKDNDKKEPAQVDPFGDTAPPSVEDPFGDPSSADKPADVDPFSSDLPEPKQPAVKKPEPPKQPARTASKPFGHGEDAIRAALAEPTSMDFIETPLHDIVDYLKDLHRLAIRIDSRALDDVGIAADVLITFNMRDIPLRSALNLMLDDLDLTWTIQDEVLLITTPEEAELRLITRVYDVSDLVLPMCDKPYDGQGLPTTTGPKPRPIFGGMGGSDQGMGGMGGGSVGGGMGMFNVTEDSAGSVAPLAQQGASPNAVCGGMGGAFFEPQTIYNLPAFDGPDMDTLIHVITGTIEPQSWDEVGGPGSIEATNRLLVISQTLDVHEQIETLLESLRAAGRAVPTVVVDARWVLLESESPDPVTLEQLTDATLGARGRITCTSGQYVNLATGERRLVAIGAIPVVGSGIGYQPVVAIPNIGIVLEVRPTVAPDRQTAVLDIRNIVTQWRDPGPPIQVGGYTPPSEVAEGQTETVHQPASGASASVDRVCMPTQQFAATMRVPLGQPVLIGGMTLSPTEDEAKELYLVIQTSITEPQ